MCVFYLICNNNNILRQLLLFITNMALQHYLLCVRYIRVFGAVMHGKAHRNVSTLSVLLEYSVIKCKLYSKICRCKGLGNPTHSLLYY